MDISQVIDECDTLRESLEGVGLSDALIVCIRFAYREGQNSATIKEGED